MKKVLIMTDFYYPNKTSIGACVYEIAKELERRGNIVHVLCFGDSNNNYATENGIDVFFTKWRIWDNFGERKKNENRISMRRIYGLVEIVTLRLFQLIHFAFFPCISFISNYLYWLDANRLYKKNKYDLIISSYAPFEATYAGFILKKKNSDVCWVNYVLDTFSNRGKSKFFSKKWNEKHGYYWEKKFWEIANAVFVMECHKKHHQKREYDFVRDKLLFTDIPLFNPCEFRKEYNFGDSTCRIMYAGRIDQEWYSPKYICELLCELLSCDMKWNFEIYGNPGDCESYLLHIEEKTKGRISMKGFRPRTEIKKRMETADVFVCFGHKNSRMVQSKIFDYMSTGKRIIHIKQGNDDAALDYFNKYKNVLVLDTKNDINNNREQLLNFISHKYNLNTIDISTLFFKNKPAYTVDLIKNYLS